MDGDHSIEICHEVSRNMFTKLFEELDKQTVYLEGTVLKPNMIISAIDSRVSL